MLTAILGRMFKTLICQAGYFPRYEPAFTGLSCRLMSRSFALGSRKLGLDNSFKRGQRLGTAQDNSLDEKPRSSTDSGPYSLLQVLLNLRLVLGTG